MNAIKNAILLIVIGLVLFGINFSVAMADVNYIYTGEKFTYVSGSYTTSQKITGSFTLPVALPPNIKTWPSINLPVFSFSDGKNNLNDRNTSKSSTGLNNFFYLETDSKGNIKNWSLSVISFEPDPPKLNGAVRSITSKNKFQGDPFERGAIGTCQFITSDGCTYAAFSDSGFTDNEGTWKITKDNANSSPQTGFQISKSGRFLEYGTGFSRRVPYYLPFAGYLVSVCPVTGGASCYALVAVAIATAGFEAIQVAKIVKDPPDPLYSEIFQTRQYQAFTLDSSSGLPQELIDAVNTAFRDQTDLASLLEAWRVTLERYNAAQAANDFSSMSLQAKALDNYITQTSRLATLAQQSFNEFLDQLEALTGPVLISPDQMQEAMNTLASNGFSDLVSDRLSFFGISSTEIEELRSTLLQDPPLSDMVDFYSVMRSTQGSYGELAAITRYVSENNQPPVAQCHDVTVSANGSCQTNASVDNGSYDPEGDPITLTQAPSGPYVLGGTGVTLTVTDSNGASASCSATVTVVDTTPPTITSVTASPNTLWPPNHKMVSVKVNATTSDNCTVTPVCTITSVTSNEPDNGLGDGDTAPDWQITGNLTVNLRAERSGTGTGRVYTVNGECTDTAGNRAPWSTTVTVPHDQ